MTVSATDVVAPVLAATEVIVFLSAGVTAQTRLRGFLRRLVLERNDLLRIAFFDVRLTWTMTRLAAGYFVFPTAKSCEVSMRSVRECFELIFVAIFTGLTAYVLVANVLRSRRWR